MATTEPEVQSSVAAVHARLREAIVSGAYAPGSPLRLQELARAYDVSMIPVREALRRLEAERFVEIVPNKGARVAPLSAADLHDVYHVRKVLEVAVLRLAFPAIDAQTVATARALNAEMASAASTQAAHDCHRRLHFTLYERAGSPWALHLVAMLWDHCERYRALATPLAGVDTVVAEHDRFLDLVGAGDLDAAAAFLESHIQATVDLLVDAYAVAPAPVPDGQPLGKN